MRPRPLTPPTRVLAPPATFQAYLALSVISLVTHGGLLLYDWFHTRELWVSALPAFIISVILTLVVWSRRWKLPTLGVWVAYGTPAWLLLEAWRLGLTTHHLPAHIYVVMGLVALLAFTWLDTRPALLVTGALLLGLSVIILTFEPSALPNMFYVFFLISMTAFMTLHGRKSNEERARSELLHALAHTDPLTGVKNRRGIWTELEGILHRTQLDSSTATILLLDIDRFKSINDRFGHDAGDVVLTQLAQTVSKIVGPENVARWGGEEFLVLLRHTSPRTAVLVSESLLGIVRTLTLPDGNGVTVSIGVAHAQEITTLDAWVDLADQRMYDAKRGGGNQIKGRYSK